MDPVFAKKKSNNKIIISIIAICAGTVIIGTGIFFAVTTALSFYGSQNNKTASYQSVKNDGNGVLVQGTQDVSGLVEKVAPGVVSIVTTEQTQRGQQYQAAGTGIVASKDGYIITNKHVVGNSAKVTVIASDGTSYDDVPVLGKDPLNDVAFLKIPNVSTLTALELGDSKTVRTGQAVVAIGNALGEYQNTVTTGIISGLGRPVQASDGQPTSSVESLTDLIQTDAAINSGNSGGPLLNASGQVIGINTAVAADAQGIGFSIPIGAVKGMFEHLKKTGKVERAVIGVEYMAITPEVKKQYRLSVNEGNLISRISNEAGSAAQAGLKKDDVITKVNGQTITAGKSVSTLIGEFQPGDKVVVTILRDGQIKEISVTLGAYNG